MYILLKKNNKKLTQTPKLMSGFTLVETLIAISIFTMSILGLMSILASGISDTAFAKQKIIASYLAQEGIEYIRNMRDTAVLYDAGGAQVGWDAFKTSLTSTAACTTGAGCFINNQTLFSCGSSVCPMLLYNVLTGKYNYDVAGVNSGFTRSIQVILVNANNIKVSSIVSWVQPSGAHNIIFAEDLFNWVE